MTPQPFIADTGAFVPEGEPMPSTAYQQDAREASRNFMTAANRLPTLFDIGEEELRLLLLLEEVTEHDDELELQTELDLIDQMMVSKVEGYVSVIRSLEAMAEARKVEADRLKARSQTAAKHAEWLRNRLLQHMQMTGRNRIETSRFTLSVRQNPEKCTVLEEMLVPQEFKKTVVTTTVDVNAIKAHLKTTGEIVPGVTISRSERLQIS